MKPHFLLVVLSFCLSRQALSQQKKQKRIDSLISALSSKKEDSFKVKLLQRIASNYVHFAPAKGFSYAQASLELSRKINWAMGIGDAENILGALAGDTGSFTASRQHFLASLDINRKAKGTVAVIFIINNIARTYGDEGDLTNQLSYSLEAFRIARAAKNDQYIAMVGTNLSAIYVNEQDFSKAFEYATTVTLAA